MTKKKIIEIENNRDYKLELIEVHDVKKEYVMVTGLLCKNKQNFMNVIGLLRTGLYDVEDAIDEAGVSKTSFYRIRSAGNIIEEKLEMMGVDYKETEFYELIEYCKLINKSMTNIQKKIKEKILERFDGKFNKTTIAKIDENGNKYEQEMVVYDKPASASELIKVAEFFDKRKRPDQSVINIENNQNNSKTEKIVFEIIDPEYILNNLDSNVYDQTLEEVNKIQEQIKNGDFNE